MESLRDYFRRRMPYMEPEQARAAKSKLALMYAILGWNIMGITIYWLFKENAPRTPNDSVDYAKLLGVKDATVVKFSGFKKVAEYDIHLTDEQINEFHNKPGKPEAEEPSQKQENTVVK